MPPRDCPGQEADSRIGRRAASRKPEGRAASRQASEGNGQASEGNGQASEGNGRASEGFS
jgi:hypothetical protein